MERGIIINDEVNVVVKGNVSISDMIVFSCSFISSYTLVPAFINTIIDTDFTWVLFE